MKTKISALLCFITTILLSFNASAQCLLSSTWEPWEPYQFKDNEGAITGLDNELIMAIGKQAGCSIIYQKRPWKRALEELKNGDLDIAPGASYSDERNAYAHFSVPYRKETMALMILKESKDKLNFSNLNELAATDISIGTVRGYFYGDQFKQALAAPNAKARIQEANSDEKNLKKLLKGRIDGTLIDPFVGVNMLKKMKQSDKVIIHPVEVSNSDIFFMLSRKSVSPDIVDRLNKALEAIKASGEYQEIVDSYLK